jgi:hypothetical protein
LSPQEKEQWEKVSENLKKSEWVENTPLDWCQH